MQGVVTLFFAGAHAAPTLSRLGVCFFEQAVCGRVILIFGGVTLFLWGLTPPPRPGGAERHFWLWLVRALWRVARSTHVAQFCGLFRLFGRKRHWYCATVAASGGSFPRNPLGAGWHLCCLALRFAGAQSGFAVCGRFEWMRFGVSPGKKSGNCT